MRRLFAVRPILWSFLLAIALQLALVGAAAACTGGGDWPWFLALRG